jgi:hypothetical protein
MPKFKVGGSFGFVGTDWEEVIEAENEDDALEYASDYVRERVEYWAVPVEEDKANKDTDND